MTRPPGLTCDPDDGLYGGQWIQHRGIRIWKPHGEPSPTLTRKNRQRLIDERYFANTWWATPELDDDPQVTRRRVAEMVADFERLDARTRPAKEVA